MNNHINFTSAYNPHMEALSSAQKFDPVKLNEMFSQVMGNIASVQALTTGNTINVRDFAPGDGSNQSVQIKAFFDSANEGDVLLFTPGHYKVVKSGWFYTFTGRSVIIRALPGAIFEVSDQGLRFEDSNHIEVSGLTLIRTTQAGWSKGRTGIHVENSSNVILQNNDISKFTDGIGVNGPSSQDRPSRNVVIRNNKLHHLGEEPIAVRSNLAFVIISENDCFRFLGDGILIKATWNVCITNNYLHTPVLSTDSDYPTFTAGLQGTNVPKVGGGITCNNEGGETGSRNMHIHANSVIGTAFGIGLIGFRGAFVTSNVFNDIRNSSVISVSFFPSQYNPGGVPNHVFVIQGNLIDTISKTSSTSAIEARSSIGTDGMDIGIISDNIIIPNGNHWGIVADGNIIIKGNYIANAGIAMDIGNGVIASNNIIQPGFEIANSDRMVSVNHSVTFTNNSISGKTTTLKVRGSNNVITGNRMKYDGSWWAVHLDNANHIVENNIIRDNVLIVSANATGRYLFGSNPFPDGKNVVIDMVKDNNGIVYQVVNDLVLVGPNSTRWKVIVDSNGNVKATKL
ncbi:right-handed parallel beta-helix repeat-containing protein [Paenibacillus sp. FSL H8-0317]|uniref:right-handed parallel beta-helix repeat-containing protein n=1 Tax=Paenibacillus sp. FSL H8-0317 TaxID=2921385 RepID=UPI003254A8A9